MNDISSNISGALLAIGEQITKYGPETINLFGTALQYSAILTLVFCTTVSIIGLVFLILGLKQFRDITRGKSYTPLIFVYFILGSGALMMSLPSTLDTKLWVSSLSPKLAIAEKIITLLDNANKH